MKDLQSKKIVIVSKEIEELARRYISNRTNEVELLKKNLEVSDYHSLKVIGHRLKGNAGSYGFDDLGVFGSAIEIASNDKDNLVIINMINNIENYLQNIDIKFE